MALQNGLPPQINGMPPQPHSRQRMPNVHEALPYTPLTSIIPFNPADIIPPPLAMPTTYPSLFDNPEEAQDARKLLDQLSAGATSAEAASERCQTTLGDVKRLLDPDSLTRYKFKRRAPAQSTKGSRPPLQVATAQLSPYAKMVFETAAVPFRYLTPESPEPEPKSVQKSLPTPQSALQHETHINGATPTPSAQQRTLQAVVVNKTLTPAQRAQYPYIPESETSTGGQDMSSSRVMSTTQQQKGDQAVHNLRNLLVEIFQAEDQLEPDTSGQIPTHSENYFIMPADDDSSSLTLQLPIQTKLESLVHKTATCGRLEDIEVEDLSRAQQLCERPVAALESLPLQIGDEWGEGDIAEWLARLRQGEGGMFAARTLLWIMTGTAQKKELQSEDHLRMILDGLRAVIEGCLIPIIHEPASTGERSRGEKGGPPQNPKFAVASDYRKEILALHSATTKTLRLLGDLLVKTTMDDTDLSTVEYLCKTLIFAENANTERDSAIGIQNFESLRRCAMDVLAKIFTKYSEQRQYIFDEVLISLEKLPATKQSARNYRLAGSKPIQLVSALLMRLVQTSATRSSEALRLRTRANEDDGEDEDEESSVEDSESDEDEIKVSPSKSASGGDDLLSITKPLHDAAQHNAQYIVHVLISRALSTSKSSDEPYRRLLDIFTEDFISCLGLPDWPAAELLLRVLTQRMIGIIDKDSSSGASRVLALEYLGTMGSGILTLQIAARAAAEATDTSDSLARPLRNMVKQLEIGSLDARDVLAFDGPYRKVVEYVHARNTNDDAQLTTARGYYLTHWAYATFNRREGSAESDASDTPRTSKELQTKLKQMLTDPYWFDEQGALNSLTTAVGNLAAMVVTLNSSFCRAFNRMFGILLNVMSGEKSSPTARSRSIKSIVTLLETDKALLDRNAYVLQHIIRCAGDPSPLVRNDALSLMDKCIALQPSLSVKLYKQIMLRTNDGSTGVRKRAMKMLKDIYLRNDSTDLRSAIANAIIARIEDNEESVVELARSTMEEIWFQPLYPLKVDGEKAFQTKIAYAAHASLFIVTVERNDEVLKILEALLKRLLTKSKAAELNTRVCKTLIAVLFDGIVDSAEIPGSPSQGGVLRSLTIFARACPALFNATHLERLGPYTVTPKTSEDLEVFRPAVTILRYALPDQTVFNRAFLERINMSVLQSLPKLKKYDLSEAVPCLWTVSEMLDDTSRIANFAISVLGKLAKNQEVKAEGNGPPPAALPTYILLAGEIGNACALDKHLTSFKDKLPAYNGNSVADLIVEALCPFANPKRPLAIRETALDAICSVCQANPRGFRRADVENVFCEVFEARIPELEAVLLRNLETFFLAQETPEKDADGAEAAPGAASGADRFASTYVANDHDGAAIAMAQKFTDSQMLRIATSSYTEAAFSAARLVVSINKQGMVHPQHSAVVLIALGTCPNKAIAAAAFKEHKAQHLKHESIYDKEYMHAVVAAWEYQAHVIGQPSGLVGDPPTAKLQLTWEVMKVAKAVVRKRFLKNIAEKMDFDLAEINASSQHLSFVRFCLENLALFDYENANGVNDLLVLLTTMEKVFAGTGSTVAQAIESEVLKLQVEGMAAPEGLPNGTSETMQAEPTTAISELESARLQQLATSSQILTLIWETRSMLIRVWNMQKHMAKAKQGKDKEAQKAPNRSTNAATFIDTCIKRVTEICAPLTTEEQCRAVCSAFVELISVDNEVKVGSEEDLDDTELLNGYDTASEAGSKKSPSLPPSGGGARGRKRKLSVSASAGATPKKRGRPPGSGNKRKSGASVKYADQDDDNEGGWD